MYDVLTTSYRLSCPQHGETSVRLSRFRTLEELPGPNHPAVYRIVFACGCGDEHPGLVAQDELDLAPLGLEEEGTFLNLMTSRADSRGGSRSTDSTPGNFDQTLAEILIEARRASLDQGRHQPLRRGMAAARRAADLTSMPSTQTTPIQRDPHPQPVPPRARLEEMLGR